ncbi:metal-dependent hydrolase [Halosimplex sp. J119]
MYRTGHFGVAMLVYAPVGAALLALGFDDVALAGGAVTVALSTVPDVDHSLPFVEHRGATHTIWFALFVGVIVGTLGAGLSASSGVDFGLITGTGTVPNAIGDLTPAAQLGSFGSLVGVLAVLSHLLGDVLTPKGITPFWPVSRAHYTVSAWRADDERANRALLTAGAAVVVAVAVANAL